MITSAGTQHNYYVSSLYTDVCNTMSLSFIQLKNMIAALYSSRDGGIKDFRRKDVHFGWDTIVRVYNGDLFRAKQGVSRRVRGLRYSYVVRDSWTRLNVLPAKIMQVKYCYIHCILSINVKSTFVHCII